MKQLGFAPEIVFERTGISSDPIKDIELSKEYIESMWGSIEEEPQEEPIEEEPKEEDEEEVVMDEETVEEQEQAVAKGDEPEEPRTNGTT